jgi:hypothetical protein
MFTLINSNGDYLKYAFSNVPIIFNTPGTKPVYGFTKRAKTMEAFLTRALAEGNQCEMVERTDEQVAQLQAARAECTLPRTRKPRAKKVVEAEVPASEEAIAQDEEVLENASEAELEELDMAV